jgi:hypothetical protein
MPREKVTLTLDVDRLGELRALVGTRSLSAAVDSAVLANLSPDPASNEALPPQGQVYDAVLQRDYEAVAAVVGRVTPFGEGLGP